MGENFAHISVLVEVTQDGALVLGVAQRLKCKLWLCHYL